MKLKTKDLTLIAMFATLITVCSWITVPSVVPFTMQTFGVLLAVGLLGGKRGTLAVAVYIMLGAVGIPVFSGFGAGVGVLLSTTGGYIVGFLASALVMWAITRCFGSGRWVLLFAMTVGIIVCYIFGTTWFMLVYTHGSGNIGLMTALGWCVFPFILPDAVKITLAWAVCRQLKRLSNFQKFIA